MPDPRIAVVGATGAVGAVTLQLLRERGYEHVRALASARSVVKELDGGVTVEEATPEVLAVGDIDLAFFSVGTSASRELVPHAVRGGAVAVDKSAAYRLQDGIPLVVPEVNGERALEHEGIVGPCFVGFDFRQNGIKQIGVMNFAIENLGRRTPDLARD